VLDEGVMMGRKIDLLLTGSCERGLRNFNTFASP
jgi:hypothetical protein